MSRPLPFAFCPLVPFCPTAGMQAAALGSIGD
jgi:hypothetical protein